MRSNTLFPRAQWSQQERSLIQFNAFTQKFQKAAFFLATFVTITKIKTRFPVNTTYLANTHEACTVFFNTIDQQRVEIEQSGDWHNSGGHLSNRVFNHRRLCNITCNSLGALCFYEHLHLNSGTEYRIDLFLITNAHIKKMISIQLKKNQKLTAILLKYFVTLEKLSIRIS